MRPRYLTALFFCVLIVACSHVTPQERTGTVQPSPVPECDRNLSKETTLSSGTLYKTWVTYDNLDYNKAFDAALFSIQSNGYSIRSMDRVLGTMHGEMTTGPGQKTLHPVDVSIARGNTSLTVNLRFAGTGEDKDRARSCSFYTDFEKKIKEGTPASSPNDMPRPPVKPSQPSPVVMVQDSAKPTTTTAETRQKPALLPSSSSPSSTPLRVTEVAWATVNLREGPGMNHRVIGSAKKGTRLQVLEDRGEWLRTCLEDGKEVWVSKSATPEAPKTPSPPAPSSSAIPSPPSPKRAPSKPASPM